MRTVLVVLVALAAVVPAAAQSTIVTPATDGASVGDEPNVHTGGPHPYVLSNNTPGYPADANGIAEARLGLAPVRVLEMRPLVGGVLPQVHDITVTWLLTPFLGQDYIAHQNAQYRVVIGHWADYNGDGIIQNDRWENSDPLAAAPLAGRDRAATTGDEWVGLENADFPAGATLVTYTSGYSGAVFGDDCGFLLCRVDAAEPDTLYRTDNNIDGWYTSLLFTGGSPYGRTFHSLSFDNQFINTAVYETYIGEPTPDAVRHYSPTKFDPADPDEVALIDVDVYQALDPTLEGIYASSLDNLRAADTDVLEARNDAREEANGTLAPIIDPILGPIDEAIDDASPGVPPTAPIVGPVEARIQPLAEHAGTADGFGSNPYDYTDAWHPWIDVEPRMGVAAPTPVLIVSGNLGQTSTDGEFHVMPGVFYPIIRHGLWWDQNADGFITNHENEEVSEGCEDLYDCGSTQAPNEYGASHLEWRGQCQPAGVDLTYTSLAPGGRWGTAGVYVFGPDETTSDDDDFSGSMNDVTSDGDVDRLITSGPIVTGSSCNASNSPWQYFPTSKVIFPEGNPDYAIKVETAEACTNMKVVGISTTECTRDTDIVSPFI